MWSILIAHLLWQGRLPKKMHAAGVSTFDQSCGSLNWAAEFNSVRSFVSFYQLYLLAGMPPLLLNRSNFLIPHGKFLLGPISTTT